MYTKIFVFAAVLAMAAAAPKPLAHVVSPLAYSAPVAYTASHPLAYTAPFAYSAPVAYTAPAAAPYSAPLASSAQVYNSHINGLTSPYVAAPTYLI